MGAAGRDFHNFNTIYKNDESFDVVAFTASQIPGIAGRKYPASLAGKLYPEGIPIEDENRLEKIIREKNINESVQGDRVDFCVEDKIVVECKAKKLVTKEDYISLQRYLQNSNKKLGIIVNFRNTYLRPKRIVRIEN